MYKKRIFQSFILIVILCTICLFCDDKQVEKSNKETPDIIITKTEETSFNLYSFKNINRKYISNLVAIEPELTESFQLEPVKENITPPIYDGFIQTDVNANYYFLKNVENYYMQIPEYIRNRFQGEGWTIIVTNNIQSKYGFTNPTMAVCDYATHTIGIEYQTGNESAVVHEMGHYLDYTRGIVSTQEPFISIYNTEVQTFRNIHQTHINNTNTSKEYFAEAFQEIIWNENVISQNCPQTYSYIKSLM